MLFSREIKPGKKGSELLVIPLCKDEKRPSAQSSLAPIALGDFTGKEGDLIFFYPEKGVNKRIALLGLGDKETLNTEKLRRAFGQLAKEVIRRKYKYISVEVPEIEGLAEDSKLRGLLEGLLIANYGYSELKTEAFSPIESVTLLGLSKASFDKVAFYETLFEGVNLARDLVNGDPDFVIPQFLADTAKKFGKPTLLDRKALVKEKLGLMLAVSKGSAHEPYLICLEYKGNPKSKDHTVLIGKGVTYDTGGLNIKMSMMEEMKSDMGGAAAVFGAFHVAKKLKLKINLSIVIPSVENATGPLSYKPGSVHKSLSGKTVEIGNTDAEGRLILADAITWAKKHLKPTRIIDIATLTGAMRVSIGPEGMGLFSNDDALADSLIVAGAQTYERAFRFPLIEEYRENLKSEIADINNVGGPQGGAIIAAMFIKEFVGDTPWAHLDIAPCAYSSQGRKYYPKLATGVGVRLLIEYLRHL